MSAHLRLLSAGASLPAYFPTPALASLRLPPAPTVAARARLLARSLQARPRHSRAVRCRSAVVAREDGGAEDRAADDEEEEAGAPGLWAQVQDIVVFAGPALGLWICGPLMSLIDTMVIGQTSSLQLAALGPGTVFCDYLCYIFMFLSVATSNMVATSIAKKDNELAQHQVSMLLFVGLACGIGMFLFTKFFGTQVLTAFTGSGNPEIISSANIYAQASLIIIISYVLYLDRLHRSVFVSSNIYGWFYGLAVGFWLCIIIRGFAWPAVLVGLVAQSASLGMKDSWGPLKALAASTVINGVGDIILCSVCGYGIAGAAWATMVSQIVAAFMMMQNLNNKGFRAFSLTIPSARELLQIFEIAAPVFVTMTSKVAFYALLTYSATSLGAITLAAHQVMLNILCMCTVWGEPLSQTAQSFMPELIYGANRNLMKARMLLKSLVIIGVICGATVGTVGTLVPWLLPSLFTNDHLVIQQMHRILIPYFIALVVTPSVHSLEGTLLAGRDLRYLSQSMGACFCIGTLLLMLLRNKFGSLLGCWWILVFFQWSRFGSALQRLISPTGVLYNENFNQVEYAKAKAT